jgi:hypothetical protein
MIRVLWEQREFHPHETHCTIFKNMDVLEIGS